MGQETLECLGTEIAALFIHRRTWNLHGRAMTEKRARHGLIVILVVFIGLSAAYAITTPTLEAPDEIYHYEYVRALVNTGRPPVLEEGGGRGFGHHAPLYYAYGALVSFWMDEADLHLWPERHNPFFGYRFGEVGHDNKNLYLHPDSDTFRQSDTWLGIRVVRLASVLLGALTIWVTFRIGREIYPSRPAMALGAAGLAAFIPEYLFISGAVNDDNGATLFGALAIWAMLRILRRGATWRRCAGLGLALGLGWLSKLTVVALVPTAALTLALVAWRDRSWRRMARLGLMTFAIAGLLIGPWLVRQTVLYGDPTGTSREMSEWGLREEPVTLANLGPDLYWLRTSFWGRLGYNQIPLSTWIYRVLDAMTVTAIGGLGYLGLSRLRHALDPGRSRLEAVLLTGRRSQLTVLSASFLMSFGPMIVRRFLRPMPNFGRYLFPVLPSIAVLMVTGLSAWLPRRFHTLLAVGLTVGMLILGAAGLTCFLAPAYARPPILTDPPESAHTANRTYLEGAEPLARLVGYDSGRETVDAGETVRVTLIWEVIAATDSDYVLFAQLFGRNGEKVGQRDTYPGLGHYPTSFWEPGEIIVDEVPIPIAADAVGPSRLRLDVGLYEPSSGRLTARDAAGNKMQEATIGWLKLPPTADPPPPETATDYQIGPIANLEGYALERTSDGLQLALHWASRASTPRDYTVFVHLRNEEGKVVAQADGPPLNGDYPTSYWTPGEAFVDQRVLEIQGLPAGQYDLSVGLYLLDTGERLPVQTGTGEHLTDGAIPLAEVQLP